MPTLTVLSLNMQGVPASQIAAAIATIQPDMVALQEAPAAAAFYTELDRSTTGGANPYGITGPVREYPNPPPVIGRAFLDAQGSMKQVVVLYKKATLQVRHRLALVNFLADPNITSPRSVQEARDQGFAARPPAYCEFYVVSGERVGLFVWHAPTRVDASHRSALDHFDDCYKLDNSCIRNDMTLLAGDFNNDNLTNYFADFQSGIQHKFDYILADKATSCVDLCNGPHKRLLDSLCTSTQDHFSMAATFTF